MVIGLSIVDGGASQPVQYAAGQLVVHRIDGYRGVVVSVDAVCKATDAWYQSEKTNANRQQPWYRILVHASGGLSAYVAHSDLYEDTSDEPIDHPRIERYFEDFSVGSYQPKTTHASVEG